MFLILRRWIAFNLIIVKIRTNLKNRDMVIKKSTEQISVDFWSGLQDSNLWPPGPKPGALPNCAKPRCSARSLSDLFIILQEISFVKSFFKIFFFFIEWQREADVSQGTASLARVWGEEPQQGVGQRPTVLRFVERTHLRVSDFSFASFLCVLTQKEKKTC